MQCRLIIYAEETVASVQFMESAGGSLSSAICGRSQALFHDERSHMPAAKEHKCMLDDGLCLS